MFGKTLRVWRLEKGITLRKFAEMVGMSPTYLSKVERGDFPPPAEDKLKRIAKCLDRNTDEVLALAGRISSDLPEIIRERPLQIATFLRTVKGMSDEDLERLLRQLQKRQK